MSETVTNEPSVDTGRSATPLLAVERLCKSYVSTVAVDDLSFSVAPGEVLGLVGPNGAGKTTTLRTIAGVLPIEVGRITIGGYNLVRSESEAKRRLAWVPDDPQPFDAMTVAEHLEFTAALYGLGRTGWQRRADDLLERFELGPKRDALGGELSRGMRQKLAFCCAWLPEPRVVLLDEPLSGLDPLGIRSAKDAIRELSHDGAAIVLSSHLLDLVEQLASRFLIVAKGRSIFQGTPAEAQARAAGSNSTLEEFFFELTSDANVHDESEPAGA